MKKIITLSSLSLLSLAIISCSSGGGDGGDGSDTPKGTPPANAAPVFSAPSLTFSASDGVEATFGVPVSDADNDTLSASLSGDDASAFTYDVSAGVLEFNTTPDYESPADVNADNLYKVTITASDGDLEATVDVEVTVNNLLSAEFLSPIDGSNLGGVDHYEVIVEVVDPDNPAYEGTLEVLLNGSPMLPYASSKTLWSLEIPVAGALELALSVTDETGLEYQNQVVVGNLTPLTAINDIAVDEARARLFVIDTIVQGLLTVSLDGSSSKLLLTGAEAGGFGWSPFTAIDIPEGGNQLYALLNTEPAQESYEPRSALVSIDLETYSITPISSSEKGSGRLLNFDVSGLDVHGQHAFVVGKRDDVVVKIDLVSGDRTVVSSSILGGGATWDDATDIAVNSAMTKAYVSDLYPGSVIEVDLTTGVRTVLSGGTQGEGPELQALDRIVLDEARARILVTDTSAQVVYSVDTATGTRTVASDTYSGISGLAMDTSGNFYHGSYGDNAIWRGDGSMVVSTRWGNGAHQLHDSSDLVLVEEGTLFSANGYVLNTIDVAERETNGFCPKGCQSDVFNRFHALYHQSGESDLLMTDAAEGLQALYSYNYRNQVLSVVSDIKTGSGPMFDSPVEITKNAASNTAYLIDRSIYGDWDDQPEIFKVNLTNGARKIIASDSVGSGELLESPQEIVVLNSRLLVFDNTNNQLRLIEIDLETGQRSTVVSLTDGEAGLEVKDATDVMVWSDSELLVLDRAQNALILIDITNGQQTLISGLGKGDGLALNGPSSIAYDEKNQRVYVMDVEYKGLFAVDVITGNRTLLIAKN